MGLVPDRTVGVPCLMVDDLPAAARYYRDVLGFEQVALLGGLPPTLAIVRKYGGTLLLQQGADAARDRLARTGPPWDAVLLVADVPAVHRELRVRGVDRLGDVRTLDFGWQNFEFQDPCGNLVCVGHASPDLGSGFEAPKSGRFAAVRARWRQARSTREERPHLRDFQTFFRTLDGRRDIFYMFFTSGLLHWVKRAESFVPADVNLVLIGSALTPDEQRWVTDNLHRPFHHIPLPVDDVTVWEFLFATSDRNFGWLDIDCFVLNGGLFAEMADLAAGDAMNCAWSWDSGYGFPVASTHFLFVNAEAVRAVAASGVRPSAGTFDWHGSSRGFRPRDCFMKVPTAAERRLLLRLLPADSRGRPQLLFGTYYDTTVLFQLLARVAGCPVHQVRPLVRRCRGSLGALDAHSTDPEQWPEDMTDELFHLYGISYYRNYDYPMEIQALYLAIELAVLDDAVHSLPAHYAARRDALAADLAGTGLAPRTARTHFRQYLTDIRGLSGSTADRVLPMAGLPGPPGST